MRAAVFAAALLLRCAAEFTVTKPQLQASVTLEANQYWHLGGFCFGHDKENPEVGRLQGTFSWSGQKQLEEGMLYVAGFDGRKEVWGRTAQNWNSSSCHEKLKDLVGSWESAQRAACRKEAGKAKTNLTTGTDGRGSFIINILQGTGTRDWHFVLLSCGQVESGMLNLVLEAEEGALSIFGANTQFHSSSCPPLPSISWWRRASSELGFWTLVPWARCLRIVLGWGSRWLHRYKVVPQPLN
eukprot:Skav207954  [mRNA]  locus=scaffold108:412784:417312:+ [translate_table: standard]